MRTRIRSIHLGIWVLAGLVALAFANMAAAAYVDPPQTVPGPGNRALLDLTGAAAPPIALLKGVTPFGVFAPAASSGPSICAKGSNAFAAAVQCAFTDNDFGAGEGWHGEWVVHNPNAAAVSFYAAFFDSWGNIYAGPATLGAGSTLWVDMLLADANPPHFSETGVTRAWAASTVPVQLNTSFSVSEGLAAFPAGTAACPHAVVGPAGITPEGAFGCRYRFFSDPSDSWTAGTQGDLPVLGIGDPQDLQRYPDLLTQVPEPGTWALLLAGFGLLGARLHKRLALAG